MDRKDYWTLYEFHMECLVSFHRLIATIDSLPSSVREDQKLLSDFQEYLDRYKEWAGNVGAGNTGEYWTLSLDFRLQDAAFLRSQVCPFRRFDFRPQSLSITRSSGLLKHYLKLYV